MAGNDNFEQQNQSTENQAGININADENQQGTSHLNEPVENEPELEKLRTELQDAKDRYLRLAAEFDNFRRRTSRERLELTQTAGREIIVRFIKPIATEINPVNGIFCSVYF